MSDFGLKYEVLQQISKVIGNHPVVVGAAIFGSRAKGTHKKYSDIDICLYGPVDPGETERIKSELSELDVIYNFDLVAFDSINNLELQEHITRCGVEFYGGNYAE